MPTNQWFQDNPKVSAYISKELYQTLETWMKGKGIRKVSQALTEILEERLGVAQSQPNWSTLDAQRLEALEEKVEKLCKDLEEIKVVQLRPKSRPKIAQDRKTGEESPLPALEGKDGWLTTKEAWELYGDGIALNTFRKLGVDEFRERFQLEADPSRKVRGKTDSRWLRRIQ